MAPPSPDPDRWPDLRAIMGLAQPEIKDRANAPAGAGSAARLCGSLIKIRLSTLERLRDFHWRMRGSRQDCRGTSVIDPISMSEAHIARASRDRAGSWR
jgi:hypothetical protein